MTDKVFVSIPLQSTNGIFLNKKSNVSGNIAWWWMQYQVSGLLSQTIIREFTSMKVVNTRTVDFRTIVQNGK